MQAAAVGLPLCWLWLRLIDQLRIEWSVNPQYAYGWAVPLMCLYLVRQRWVQAGCAEALPSPGEERIGIRPGAPARLGMKRRLWGRSDCLPKRLMAVLLALSWFPTRLVEEANPEWRLVSWALALEVIGLSFLVLGYLVPARRLPRLVFPLCFFLIAVPWPTLIENPLIQTLSRANAAIAAEFLGLAGVPALQRGNSIEVAGGVVGLDEACSGIRSLQAGLMLSLFLGEFYRISRRQRVGLCLAGLLVCFGFNVGRTMLLASLAATRGVPAMASWHDPAGIILQLLCFGCVWALARAIGVRKIRDNHTEVQAPATRELPRERQEERAAPEIAGHACSCGLALALWLVLAEGATELWYRIHEWYLPPPVTWAVELPRRNLGFQERGFSEAAKRLLRFSRGWAGCWQTAGGVRCQAIFLQWDPGRIAAHLASAHTPDKCLTAAGGKCVQESGPRGVWVHDLDLKFRTYWFRDDTGPVYVFYTLWRDRGERQNFYSDMSIVRRLEAVGSGRRNCGQRSLEFGVWDVESEAEAEKVLVGEIGSLLQRP